MTSSSCSVCGSTQTKVMDGLMYCEICGTQIFDFREIEAEDEGAVVMSRAKVARRKTREVLDRSRTNADSAALGLATASSRKKRKGEMLERIIPASSTKTPSQPNELVKDVTTGREHAPGYLRRIGCRISTFTKMLAKGVAMIRQDAAVPRDFPDHVLAVYQRYLAACNVAFTSVDYTEDLEVMFRALVLNTNIAFEQAQEKKEKKARKKTRGKEALEKSATAWELLMSDTLNENLEMQSDDEQEEEFNPEMPTTSETPKKPRMVTVVDTKIPKEALQNATSILLSVDSLAAILYVSVVTIGCRWILLSDILRWMREGRFGITVFQLTALVPKALEKIEKTGKSPCTKLNFPLNEFLRTALFVWQLCRLPPIPVKVDFEQPIAQLFWMKFITYKGLSILRDSSDKSDKSDKSDWGDGRSMVIVLDRQILPTDHTVSLEPLASELLAGSITGVAQLDDNTVVVGVHTTAVEHTAGNHHDPACSELDPKEDTLMDVSCDVFDYGREDINNDRITVEWCNIRAAKQFPCEWFQGNGNGGPQEDYSYRVQSLRRARIKAVARLLYHLNLPEVLTEHVLLLIEKARPCTDLDGEALRRQGRMEQGPFSHGFSFDPKDRKKKTFMLTAFGRPRPTKTNRNSDIFFSTETKALAFILLALKLCFGLDDVREYRVNKETENRTATRFNFIQWFYQLKMRIMLWEGHDPLEIFQMNKPVDPLLYEEDFPGGRLLYDDYNYNITCADEGKRGYFIRYWHRDARFDHCIPPSMRIDSSTSIPNPFPEDTYDIQPNMNDDESLYTPLRHQTNVLRAYLMRPRTAEEKQELNSAVDEAAVRIFKTEFSKSSLASDPSSSCNGAQQTDSSSGQRSRWQSCFPCAKGYVRYPRPRFTNAGVLHVKEDDGRMKNFNKKMGLCSTSSGIRLLFASRKAAVDALEAAKPAMSHTFAMLLKWFSKIIGESDFVLYGAFVMLEYQIVDRARFNQLKQFMLDGRVHEIKSTAINRQGERSFKTLYVSPAEDISDASQIEEVRIGLPRNWAMVETLPDDGSVEELDFSTDSDSEEDSDSDDSSEEENEQGPSTKETVSSSLPRDVLERSPPAATPLNASAPNGASAVRMTRELSNYQRHIRAYEFDIIWMLIAMRYW